MAKNAVFETGPGIHIAMLQLHAHCYVCTSFNRKDRQTDNRQTGKEKKEENKRRKEKKERKK